MRLLYRLLNRMWTFEGKSELFVNKIFRQCSGNNIFLHRRHQLCLTKGLVYEQPLNVYFPSLHWLYAYVQPSHGCVDVCRFCQANMQFGWQVAIGWTFLSPWFHFVHRRIAHGWKVAWHKAGRTVSRPVIYLTSKVVVLSKGKVNIREPCSWNCLFVYFIIKRYIYRNITI